MAETLLGFKERGETIARDVTQLIGNTPMVMLSDKINKTHAKIALKLESENPLASVKDRLALSIVHEAEKAGKLKPGSTIVEVTSGNTGIGLCFVAAVRGYKAVIIMPEQNSLERRALMQIFGAQLILTPASLGMKGAKRKLAQLVKENPDYFDAEQFETSANAKIHYETTGPEVWAQTAGKVGAFVAGVGTGGTVTGVGRFLKEKNAAVKVFAMEPDESAVLSGDKPGPHFIQGTGAGFIPDVMKAGLPILDGIIRVKSADALAMGALLPRSEGLFTGISAGANVVAALQVAAREDMAGKLVVAVVPSFGERYLSTKLFAEIKDQAAKWPVVPAEELPDPAAAPPAAAAQ